MNIFFTLDYELFMGSQTGTPMKCLIEPMDILATSIEKYSGARFTIFVDAAYLLKLSMLAPYYENAAKEYKLVSEHVRNLELRGHDIELHFHPQWLYSDYDENGWIMDMKHYKLSDMTTSDVNRYFPLAKKTLDDIIGRSTIGFRAGGYSLRHCDGSLLMTNGIHMDSSVVGNGMAKGRFQQYDYRNAPRKSEYRFSDDITKEDCNGSIIELPITHTKKYSGPIYLLKKRSLQKRYKISAIFGDGRGIGLYMSKFERLKSHIRSFIRGKSFVASIDGLMIENLSNIYKTCKDKGELNMIVIGHPKSLSMSAIKRFEDFLSNINEADRITTFRQYYEERE